jgi:hypothetical protein
MANDHDKFTCSCDKCTERYNEYLNDNSNYLDNLKNVRKPMKKNQNLSTITFKKFEEAYVSQYGQCKTKEELRKFFNMALKLGLKK